MKKKTDSTEITVKEKLTGAAKAKKIIKTVLNTIVNVMIVLVLIISILVAIMALSSKANGGISSIFGMTIQPIQTDSMKGGSEDYEGGDFSAGDLLIGKSTGFDPSLEYQIGDIVTFKGEIEGQEALIAHRIINVNVSPEGFRTYQTQGDNRETNTVPDQRTVDEYITAAEIGSVFYSADYHGSVWKGVGGILAGIQTQQGFFFVVLLPMILFFMYALFRVVWNAATYRKQKEMEQKEQNEEDKQKAIDAAVKAALEAQGTAPAADEPAAEDTSVSADEMEEFKQFMAFKKAQQAQAETEAEQAPEEPAEETTEE